MIKRILFLFALFASPLLAQTSLTGRWISGPAALRPTCSASFNFATANSGDVYDDTDDTGVFKCMTGVWSSIGTGGGGSQVYPGAGVALSNGSAWLTSLQVGTAANNLVQLNGSAQLPALSAANLFGFPTFNQNTTGNAATTTNISTNGTNGQVWSMTSGSTQGWATVSGGGSLPTETQYCGPYYATTTTLGCILSPAVAGLYLYGWNPTSAAAVAPSNIQVGFASTAISGATNTYTFLYSDCYAIKEHDQAGSSAVTLTVPTPATLNNTGCALVYSNHSTHADVFTPSGGWQVQVGATAAASTYSIPSGQFCRFTVDAFNATTWDGDCVTSVAGAITVGTTTVSLPSGSAITSGSCSTATPATVTGALTTDGLITNFSGDFSAITGYSGVGAVLTIYPWITSNTVNVKTCNWTGSSITPSAATLGVKVVR